LRRPSNQTTNIFAASTNPKWFRLAEGLQPRTFCEAELTLFASFSGKRRRISNQLINFLGASPQTPVVPLRGRFACSPRPSAKQNKRFLLLFLEKEEVGETEWSIYWGGGQPPVVPLRGRFEAQDLLRSRTNAFCFFFWKKKKLAKRSKTVTPVVFEKKKNMSSIQRCIMIYARAFRFDLVSIDEVNDSVN
jgi:hypothetical protein